MPKCDMPKCEWSCPYGQTRPTQSTFYIKALQQCLLELRKRASSCALEAWACLMALSNVKMSLKNFVDIDIMRYSPKNLAMPVSVTNRQNNG